MGVQRKHEGYVVDLHPYELRAGGWRSEFYLQKEEGNSLLITQFLVDSTLPSEETAIQAAFESARHKIEAGFDTGPITL
jgi:hypothetical protein